MAANNPAKADSRALTIIYRNWRGEISERQIVPMIRDEADGLSSVGPLWFGITKWHPVPCWLLHALDTAKGERRDFRLIDVIQIK